MPRVVAYHRPTSVEQAGQLLQRAGVHTKVLAGGTQLNAGYQSADVSPIEYVDLQALALEGLELDPRSAEAPPAPRGDGPAHTVQNSNPHAGRRIRIGSMTTLGALAGSSLVPPLLRDLARRELPSTLRNMATIGGTIIAAESESAFLAGLLALRAEVHWTNVGSGSSSESGSLADFLSAQQESVDQRRKDALIITALAVTSPIDVAHERAGRTPADTPIVSVTAARYHDGITIAASGVAEAPTLVAEVTVVQPPGDFRGSTEYRRELFVTLSARAQARLVARASSEEAHS